MFLKHGLGFQSGCGGRINAAGEKRNPCKQLTAALGEERQRPNHHHTLENKEKVKQRVFADVPAHRDRYNYTLIWH